MQMLAMLPVMIYTKTSPWGPPDWATRLTITAQGVLGGIFLLVIIESMQRLPIGDCTAIFYSAPVFTMFLSAVLLRDHCGLYRTLIGLILLSGIVIICRPPILFPTHETPGVSPIHSHKNLKLGAFVREKKSSDSSTGIKNDDESSIQKYLGIGIALVATTIMALLAIITRKARHVHWSILVFWFAAGGFVISTLSLLLITSTNSMSTWDTQTWICCLLQSFLGIIGSILMTKAVCWVLPAKTMVIRSVQILISYGIQIQFFGTVPHLTDLLGAVLVVVAVLGMGLEDRILATSLCTLL